MRSFNLDTQVANSPREVSRLLAQTEPPRLDPNRPVLLSGIGTSLHAARIGAEWISRLSEGAVRPLAVDAHDLGTSTPVRAGDQVVVISHRGTKRYPTVAQQRALAAGANTWAIAGQDAPEQPAPEVLRTSANETAGTFSLSYLASLTVLARIAATFEVDPNRPFGQALDPLPAALSATLDRPAPTMLAQQLSGIEPLLIVGFGLDAVTAEEAALKVKEGAWTWTEAMATEFALHGTPASFRADMATVVICPEADDGDRTHELLTVLKELDVRVVAECGQHPHAGLGFESPHPLLRAVTGIVPFQRLTAELARVRGTDPDTLHGHRHPWKTLMTQLPL